MSVKAALILVTLVLVGCAGFTRRLATSVDEYAVYRRYRTASTLQAKLAAGHQYLVTYPTGSFKDEVRTWFGPAQDAYLRSAWDDPEALRRFLDAVPQGDPAKRAAERIVELDLEHAHAEKTERQFEEHVGRLTTRFEEAERGRRELVTGFSAWVKRLAAIRQWYGRTSDLDSDFIYAYRLADDPATCDTFRCTKTISVKYAIPEQKDLRAREAVYDVILDLKDGGVVRAVLSGAELFSRIGEAVYLAPVSPSGYRARIEAIARTSEMVAVTTEPTLPQARCAVEPVSPVILHRRCDGVELRVVAGLAPSEQDQIVIEPVTNGP